MSKGSRSRITDKERYDREYERIYGMEGAIRRARKAMLAGYRVAPFNQKMREKS